LSAGRIVSRIAQCLQVELPLRFLFESPTISELIPALAKCQRQQVDDHDMEQVLDTIEQLTDEEAVRLARQYTPPGETK